MAFCATLSLSRASIGGGLKGEKNSGCNEFSLLVLRKALRLISTILWRNAKSEAPLKRCCHFKKENKIHSLKWDAGPG